ncbi:hypothetical protein HYDPIDRAFT_99616 [Hydnomerulius pinastri MD-312]|uniref:DUF6699 domain-containing protein n=1 Tax=Hydnomerulius pinastri MD-312 TaxID=994086 RepID=A0A0C9WA68_9AGAM|nr:hypothetical protein HYDPIDRAFT_99616 [Hydnomerulius pinastri MD-312]
MPGKQVRFNDDNIFYSPTSTPSPSFSESSLPSSSGPRTPPQNYIPLALPTGPVAIHPLLGFHPKVAPIIYDVSYPPNTLAPNIHASPVSFPARVLDEPATQPPLHTLTLFMTALPTQDAKDEVTLAFHTRCRRIPSQYEEQKSKGVKRVDFLRNHTTFMGLSSTKRGPDVWAVNLA